MGGASTAWAAPRFGASGDLRVFASLKCPRSRALNSNEDSPAALTLSGQQFGRLVGHYGKSQLGAGRRAGWEARPSIAAENFRDLPKACSSDPGRRGGAIVVTLGQFSRSLGAQPYAQSPFVAFLSISRPAFQ